VDTDFSDSQNFLPHGGNLTFYFSERSAALADRGSRGGKGAFVDFTVGCPGEGAESFDAGRDHRRGQLSAQIFPQ